MAFSFPADLPIVVKIDSELVFDLNDGQSSLIREYFNLMWREAHQPEVMSAVIEHLQLAMLMKLYHINEMQQILRDVTETREHVTLNRFIRLVIEHSTLHRNIPFYADILCLTPNRLGAVIKQASGLTARQWINRFVIQEAKVQLKYSNHSILEISEQLNFPNPSFFSKFFKRETGMTPNEYRHL
ncbi:MAG: AraC family transcriptional regulator [Muribaculaceae bacterium]|nr:AraC family transcriptional regulator [Muribaculaceae bacterium]